MSLHTPALPVHLDTDGVADLRYLHAQIRTVLSKAYSLTQARLSPLYCLETCAAAPALMRQTRRETAGPDRTAFERGERCSLRSPSNRATQVGQVARSKRTRRGKTVPSISSGGSRTWGVGLRLGRYHAPRPAAAKAAVAAVAASPEILRAAAPSPPDPASQVGDNDGPPRHSGAVRAGP
ncbi:hypothetical protein GQ53DRAFT_157025 [Thozetella sp. PMI_491]|nr:hypothetical protein GQ53DRAFT_157025 [Thozetella sp. PMI_491]